MKNKNYFDLKKRIYWYTVLKKECNLSFWDEFKLEFFKIKFGILSYEFYCFLRKCLIEYNLKKYENFDQEWEQDILTKYLENKQKYNY